MPLKQHIQYPDVKTKEGKALEGMMFELGAVLEKKYNDYKGQRDRKEQEWIEAVHQYEGRWNQSDQEKIEQALSMQDNTADPISVNITRPKTNIAIARMKDIQFPTGGDFNFFLRPADLSQEIKDALEVDTPDAEMGFAAAQAGVPPQQTPAPKEIAQTAIEENVQNAPKMERQLRTRMVHAEYGRKARLAIEDLCILGTAVLKGPTLQNKKRNKYAEAQTSDGETIQVLEETWEGVPSLDRVDPRYFYPDPSARLPEEVEDAIELHQMSGSGLAELARNPAFMPEQISMILKEEPNGSDTPALIQETSNDYGQTSKLRYFVKEFHGPLDKKVLFEAGMISEEDKDDPLKRVQGEVWYCQGHVIRISLNAIEGAADLPYSLTTYEKDPNSVFGHGVPYLLRNPQRVVNSAYIMLLDNASLTSGPQIVINKEMMEPAQKGDYSIRPMKVWFMTEYGQDVREAMQFVDIPAQMESIASIVDQAMQFADIESSTPLMQQGELPSGNNTTTGLAMVMSASNIVQKNASMEWDDNITRPMIQRWYHYEMQYGEDNSLKGDFEVEVGGATERIESDLRAQELEKLLGLAGSSEEFMMQVDANKAFRALVDNARTGDVLRSKEEVEKIQEQQQAAAQEQGPDPEVIKAQAALITAEARMEEAKAKSQKDNAEQQTSMIELQARYQSQIAEAQARQNEAALNYQIEMMKLAAEKEITVEQLKTELAIAKNDTMLKLQLKEIDFAQFQAEVDVKEEFGEGI